MIQEITVAQENASIQITLWGNLVKQVKEDKSYSLSPVKIRQIGDCIFLTTKPNTEIRTADDVPV